jgi:hypothetical protein
MRSTPMLAINYNRNACHLATTLLANRDQQLRLQAAVARCCRPASFVSLLVGIIIYHWYALARSTCHFNTVTRHTVFNGYIRLVFCT